MSGQVVRGDKYFSRDRYQEKVWLSIERGGHILLLSPRRAGKTSLLAFLEDNPKEDYVFLYVMVQSCNTQHDFYQRVIEKLYDSEHIRALQKTKNAGINFFNSAFTRVKSIKIGSAGITFQATEQGLNHVDLIKVLQALKIEKKLVLIIDEYPDVVENIEEKQGSDAAIEFLKTTRSLTQISGKENLVQIIFTGSIGLTTLATKLGESGLINDLSLTHLTPLTEREGKAFVEFLSTRDGQKLKLTNELTDYMLKKVYWLMPYYIQILWDRLVDYCIDNEITEPSNENVDSAYECLFSQNYRSNFAHWAERLNRFQPTEKNLAKALLKQAAASGLSKTEFHNYANDSLYVDCNSEYVLNCLEMDGYLAQTEKGSYQFTSPILRVWWSRYAEGML